MKNKEEILYNSISKHGGLKGVSLEQFMDSINNGSTDMRKGLESTFEAMEEYRNQPPVYPLPAKEEAEMLVEEFSNATTIWDGYDWVNVVVAGKQCAVSSVLLIITALKLAGVSTKYHEEVLTILKGM